MMASTVTKTKGFPLNGAPSTSICNGETRGAKGSSELNIGMISGRVTDCHVGTFVLPAILSFVSSIALIQPPDEALYEKNKTVFNQDALKWPKQATG